MEYLSKLELWRGSLRTIEGYFGTGVVAYFLFLRWLMILNFFIFILLFSFVVIPQIVLAPRDMSTGTCEIEVSPNSTECCSESYLNNRNNSDFNVLDIIQGTGFMEKTLMFYGYYSNRVFEYSSKIGGFSETLYYDLPLAYICITIVYFLVSLIAIVRSAAKEFTERLVEGEGQFYQYCNLVFGGWDYCIHNEKSANIKHRALFNEIKGLLRSKLLEAERNNRTRSFMLKLIVIRIFINLIVILVLISAAVSIYYLFNFSLEKLDRNYTLRSKTLTDTIMKFLLGKQSSNDEEAADIEPIDVSNLTVREIRSVDFGIPFFRQSDVNQSLDEQMLILFYEFLPYLGIVLFNLICPLLFNYLVKFEDYTPKFVINIQLFRTVFLRLSSLIVLLSRFYYLIRSEAPEVECYEQGTPQCWETFVGQQFYKLLLTDFATQILVTFFINFPRAFIARYSQHRMAKILGEQEFELPKHVLDVVYTQTLCWLGSFYSPLIPAIAFLLNFFMFYIKRFACLINSKPSTILYRASRSNSMFMFVLLVSYTVAIVPIAYAISEIVPSKSCGPFRGLHSVWDAAIAAFMKLPGFIRNIIFFLGTAGFAVPCLIFLSLAIYYYYAVLSANKHMVQVLKNQLILEGHDKQFLLERLSAFIKQHQEMQKKQRQIEQKQQRNRVMTEMARDPNAQIEF